MRKLCLILVLCAVGSISYGQSFSFGPKAGVNISNYTGKDIESDALVGFHLGGLLNFGIGRNFSIQPEVLFSTQGAKIDGGVDKAKYKTSYVTLPVMFKLRANGGFYIEAGPQAGFRTSEDIPDQTIDHFAKDLDLAGAFGIGYQSGFGLGVGARYVAGFSKVGDFDNAALKSPDFKNSVIQLSLFFAIPVVK